MRTLLGGVGYRNLRDHSVGPVAVDHLQCRDWPAHVSVEDLSYNPIAVVQRLEDEPPALRFTRLIVVGAPARSGSRPAGAVTAYRWDGVLPSDEGVQAAVSEAVTGIIAIDNTLIVCRHFGVLPEETLVLEVEPDVHEFGAAFSPAVERAFEPLCALLTRLALDPGAGAGLPTAPLGGGMVPAAEPR